MAETEVENILREIRERVVAQQRAAKDVTPLHSANGDNGAGEPVALQQVSPDESMFAENVALLNSYLTTTARAWDRLPPLVSNRSGLTARLELWLKRQLKRSTRWFAWEQVNFNAAVHHALRDLLPIFAAHEHELLALRERIANLEKNQIAQLKEIQAEIRAERDTQRTEVDADRSETRNRIEGLVNELRERDEHLRDEQRVCYKQLALETSEAAVLEDRARRKTEALLEELQRRVASLETGTK
ncbi:MAG TPA: hypothetical protein VGO68_07515 [Pyrinomonadaceae bacterium]|jgi:hypothetical protein|nr:hypothetical protein [Pyrinomonadaceae bacterium]